MKTRSNPSLSSNLSLIRQNTTPLENVPEPPAKFGKAGLKLWVDIMSAYAVDDTAGRELLAQACATADRVAALKARIDEEGEVIVGRSGLKEHPGLRAEASGRSFIIHTIQKLGINVEPLRPVGRPPKSSYDWKGDDE